jgi:hypothetical protein
VLVHRALLSVCYRLYRRRRSHFWHGPDRITGFKLESTNPRRLRRDSWSRESQTELYKSMSIEHEIRELSGSVPQSLDVTGLPTPVADELRRLVETLRDNMGQASSPATTSVEEPPDVSVRRLQAWVDAHPVRAITIDDDRESLYSGRGE